MSWQFIETGLVRDVEKKLSSDLEQIKLPEPEHTQLQHTITVIKEMLKSYPWWYGVQIKVRGAQMPAWNFRTGKQHGWTNALALEISPLPSFVIDSGKLKIEDLPEKDPHAN